MTAEPTIQGTSNRNPVPAFIDIEPNPEFEAWSKAIKEIAAQRMNRDRALSALDQAIDPEAQR